MIGYYHQLFRATSYLDTISMHSVLTVNKLWNGRVVKLLAKRELSLVNNFANFLINNLKKKSHENHRECLNHIVNTEKTFNIASFKEFKDSIIESREKILNILKNLKELNLIKLEYSARNEKKPLYFNNLFELAIIYQEIDKVDKLTDENRKHSDRQYICTKLTKIGNIDKAIEIANKAIKDLDKHITLINISVTLVKDENIDKALNVINTITNDRYGLRDTFLEDTSYVLNETKNFNKAIEVANKIANDEKRIAALQKISKELETSN